MLGSLPEAPGPVARFNVPVPDFSSNLDDSPAEENDGGYSVPIVAAIRFNLPQISRPTFARVLDGDLRDRFDDVVVLDCRFHYEFTAGHIINATNLLTRKRLHKIYDDNIGRRVCVVFHCELSVDRGPTWASLFRELDRGRTGCTTRTSSSSRVDTGASMRSIPI
jgi:M-phase inducer tyrosine phosphatase